MREGSSPENPAPKNQRKETKKVTYYLGCTYMDMGMAVWVQVQYNDMRNF